MTKTEPISIAFTPKKVCFLPSSQLQYISQDTQLFKPKPKSSMFFSFTFISNLPFLFYSKLSFPNPFISLHHSHYLPEGNSSPQRMHLLDAELSWRGFHVGQSYLNVRSSLLGQDLGFSGSENLLILQKILHITVGTFLKRWFLAVIRFSKGSIIRKY